ncbi:MAG: SDR family oxidoreductase [Bacteroidales bacterium]|nr:SDR family oxidoreductase [Bacteroidales bacterium]
MSKRILVTGGAGFLGSHLCHYLLERGNEVLCIDNMFTGRRKNIIPFLDNPNFEFIRHDVTMPFFAEVDEIYNLACPASPIHYQYNAIKTIKTSVLGAVNMLGLAKRVRARILQASTSEVYGDPLEHPQKETYWGHVNPIGPRSCYDEGKRCAESLFINYHKFNQVRIKILRIFNTYGPRMDPNDGRVISNFIMQALRNEDITVFGEGRQSRSFCYVDDMVRGMVAFMESDPQFTGPCNMGNPVEFSILQLAKEIIRLTGSSSSIIYKPLPEDDPMQRRPDISLATEKLGWKPETHLETGLLKTIEYFKTVL